MGPLIYYDAAQSLEDMEKSCKAGFSNPDDVVVFMEKRDKLFKITVTIEEVVE